MKAMKTLVFPVVILLSCLKLHAQSNAFTPSKQALVFADSMLNCFRLNNFEKYIDISYPGIVRYYGGKKNYEEFIRRSRSISPVNSSDVPHQLKLIDIRNESEEWQCILEKSTHTKIDGKDARVITYLVGQSKDGGNNWKFIDVAFTSVDDITFIMPDIFNTLAIPQRQIVFSKPGIAKNL